MRQVRAVSCLGLCLLDVWVGGGLAQVVMCIACSRPISLSLSLSLFLSPQGNRVKDKRRLGICCIFVFLREPKSRQKLVRVHQIVARFCAGRPAPNCPRASVPKKLIGRRGGVMGSHWGSLLAGTDIAGPKTRTEAR